MKSKIDSYVFFREKKLLTQLSSKNVDNLKLMKDTITALPQFQEMKTKYAIHINICQECRAIFEKRKLDSIAAFEQVFFIIHGIIEILK